MTTTILRGSDRELIEGLRDELNRYPISYEFGRLAGNNFVQIKTATGGGPRITFSAKGHNAPMTLVKTRGEIRRALRKLSIEPKDGRTRCGTLGLAIVDKAREVGGPVRIERQIPINRRPPAIEPEPDDEEVDDYDALCTPATLAPLPLCPDAIREDTRKIVASVPATTQQKETPNMLARPDKTPTEAPAASDNRLFVKLLQSETTQATRLLCTNAEIDDAARLVTYRDGWSDERIHKILAAAPDRSGLKLQTITDWRRREFGDTPAERAKAAKAMPVNETTNRLRIESLEKTVADLLGRVTAIEDAATRPGA